MSATVIRGLFSDDIHTQIRMYLADYGPILPKIKDDAFARLGAHNPQFFTEIHHQLSEFASEIFGEEVKPSYCFLSMYGPEGICPIHVDRPQCRYTIDYLIEQEGDTPWPIYISEPISEEQRAEAVQINSEGPSADPDAFSKLHSIPSGWKQYDLRPNDAICYSGTHSVHYRERASIPSATLIFWHFVPADFDGDLR